MTAAIVKVNVGGELFYFAKATLQLAHNKGSVLEKAVNELFLDIDPAIFRTYCAPFIRHQILPQKVDYANSSEIDHVVATCKSIGLTILADSFRKDVTVKVNVGGQSFSFAKSTLQLPHNSGSALERAVSGVYDGDRLFLDIDPAIFSNYCAPFIRHQILPVYADFEAKTVSEVNHAIAACNSIGLHTLADEIQAKAKAAKPPVIVHRACNYKGMVQ